MGAEAHLGNVTVLVRGIVASVPRDEAQKRFEGSFSSLGPSRPLLMRSDSGRKKISDRVFEARRLRKDERESCFVQAIDAVNIHTPSSI